MKAFQGEHVYHHFSHHHPMVRRNLTSARDVTCSGCKLNMLPAKSYYQCESCPFYLHQVCYNMPRKTRHPGHPDHFLTLHIMPSSGGEEIYICEACGDHINGFYYYCSECSVSYHILCSALPLSVAITSHLHTLKLEFSPPYDLQCDICKELASYNGWLYRCQICEFDTHLACAISHQRTQSFQHPTAPLPALLTRQIMHTSASLMETKQREDYVNEGTELMQLVSQGVTRNIRGNRKQDNFLKPVVGWDERLHSPKTMVTIRNGQDEYSASSPKSNTSTTSPNLKVQALATDQSSLLSGDQSTNLTPSYQFSDGCFSIDLAGSYSTPKSILAKNEPKPSDASGLQKVREATNDRNNSMIERITNNFEPTKEQTVYSRKESFDFHNSNSRMKEVFLIKDGTHSGERKNRKKSNESKSVYVIREQSSKSEIGTSESSCWWKLFQCCFSSPKYERNGTVFSDGTS